MIEGVTAAPRWQWSSARGTLRLRWATIARRIAAISRRRSACRGEAGPGHDPTLGVQGRAPAERLIRGAGDLVSGVVAGPDERPRLDVPEAQRKRLVPHRGELVGVVVALQ